MKTINNSEKHPESFENKNISLNKIIDNTFEYIKKIFFYSQKYNNIESFTDIENILSKRLKQEINKSEDFFKDIINFIKDKKNDLDIVLKIKYFWTECQRKKYLINDILKTIEKHKSNNNSDIDEAISLLEILGKLEKIFQSLRMEKKSNFKINAFETISDLYDNIDHELYYTTPKSINKKMKVKIKNINIQKNEIFIKLESESKNENKNNKIEFTKIFKAKNNKINFDEINKYFSKYTKDKEENRINQDSLYKEINRIIDKNNFRTIQINNLKQKKAL